MSSESDEYRPSSSTPETPRKRRRASTASSRPRKHKQLRRHGIESSYNDDYRVLFNEHVELAASRFEVSETAPYDAAQIGSSLWTYTEKAVLFTALERLGRNDLPGIAGAVNTKTEAETRAFLLTLQDATIERGDTKLTLRDIPAAIELGSECSQHLERAADALAWYQERHDASLEQERYGEHWLITPRIAGEIENAINGVLRPRSASTPHHVEPKRTGSRIARSCIQCKKRKVKCDRDFPCGRCALNERYCEYPERPGGPREVCDAPRVAARPRSASRPLDQEHDQAGGGYFGSCVACKSGKRKCDRGTPCERCAQLHIDCQYALVRGAGVAGACERCRRFKSKCDRSMPCANCTRTESECVYADSNYGGLSRPTSSSGPPPDALKKEQNDEGSISPIRDEVEPQILQVIPEATLVNAQTMLMLSRTLFMNRSPDFPSPWLHWSEYTSELASEPSIYRTAFNDFHRLAVSVTKRLVHVALMQAESRLRSQRPRARHEVQPFLKKRDVRAAVDVLGMKRDRKERWKGVARRCGLKVVSSTSTSRGKHRTVVPWSEVERIMSTDASRESHLTTDMESSTDPEEFKRRAARSGTPLPMQNLTLSDSEDETEDDSVLEDDDMEITENFADATTQHHRTPARDNTGRFMSVAPDEVEERAHQLSTVENFDLEASRQEQQALWDLLGLAPTSRNKTTVSDDDTQDAEFEKSDARDQDWRQIIRYRAPWEAYDRPPTATKFIASQRPLSPMPATNDMLWRSSKSRSNSTEDDSSTSGARRRRKRAPAEVELRARGTKVYAAMQRQELDESDLEDNSSSLDAANDDEVMEQDIPTQSIEAGGSSSDY